PDGNGYRRERARSLLRGLLINKARENALRRGQRRSRRQRMRVELREAARSFVNGKDVEKLRRRFRNDWLKQDRGAAHGFSRDVKYRRHARRIGLAQRPRLLRGEIAIGRADDIE